MPWSPSTHKTSKITLKKGTVIKFADDNNIVIGNKKYNILIETVNSELEKNLSVYQCKQSHHKQWKIKIYDIQTSQVPI